MEGRTEGLHPWGPTSPLRAKFHLSGQTSPQVVKILPPDVKLKTGLESL
jgi:hypothetical protein